MGRVAAIDDENHNRTHGDNLAFFGFFEAKDQDAALALLATALLFAVVGPSRGRPSAL